MLKFNRKRKFLLPLRKQRPTAAAIEVDIANINGMANDAVKNGANEIDSDDDLAEEDYDDDLAEEDDVDIANINGMANDAMKNGANDFDSGDDLAEEDYDDDLAEEDYDDDLAEEDDDDDSLDEDYDDDTSVCSIDRNITIDEVLHNKVIAQLQGEGIEVHLESELTSRSLATVRTMMNRYAKLIIWFHKKENETDADMNVVKMLNTIVLRRFQMLTKYYQYLRNVVLSKPSTVYNLNEDISILLNWFAVFRESNDEHTVHPGDLYAVNLVIKAMRKFYSKERRVMACKSSTNTVEGLIKANKWPIGGLKELHSAVVSEIQWARNVSQQNSTCLQDPTTYNRFMQLLLSSFYTGTQRDHIYICYFNIVNNLGSPQGRVGAFNETEFEKGDELLQELFTMSTKFKTSVHFGLQPITTCSASIELLQIYLQKFRPRIKENPKDPLFISLSGNVIRVGRFVAAFFKRVAGLNITTTTIRSIVATESATLLNTGAITAEARDSIQNISGHSGETSKKYYQKRSRLRDMENATLVHSKILGMPTSDIPDSNDLDNISPAQALDDDNNDDYFIELDNMFATPDSNDLDNISPAQALDDDNNDDYFIELDNMFATPTGATTTGLLHPFPPLDSVLRVSYGSPTIPATITTPTGATTTGLLHPFPPLDSVLRVSYGSPTNPATIATPTGATTTGLLHPFPPLDSVRRVPWSPKEISIVGTWCKRFREQHPGNINVVAKCLEFINKNDKVKEHFHPHHVMDSARLRWGWQKYQEEQREKESL